MGNPKCESRVIANWRRVADSLMKLDDKPELARLRQGLPPCTVQWIMSGTTKRKAPFEDQSAEVQGGVIEARERMTSADFFKLLLRHHVRRSPRMREIVWPLQERDHVKAWQLWSSNGSGWPRCARQELMPWAFNKDGDFYADIKVRLRYMGYDIVSTLTVSNDLTNSFSRRALLRWQGIKADRARLMTKTRAATLNLSVLRAIMTEMKM